MFRLRVCLLQPRPPGLSGVIIQTGNVSAILHDFNVWKTLGRGCVCILLGGEGRGGEGEEGEPKGEGRVPWGIDI